MRWTVIFLGWLCFCGFASAEEEDSLAVILYAGYGSAGKFTLEGRVIELDEDTAGVAPEDGGATNLRRNLAQLFNAEQENVEVRVQLDTQHWRVKTDEEGYFRLDGELADAKQSGWLTVTAHAESAKAVEGGVYMAPSENRLGVISDLDDTLMISEVTAKTSLLKNTFLKNPLQREAVPGASAFIASVIADNAQWDASPVFYLSASPRQLYGNITLFLEHNGFPRGVVVAKKVSNESDSEPWLDQAAYKTAHIEDLLRRFPRVNFVLLGDDGERDPEIYRDIQARFADRIAAVYIRKVSPDPERPVYEGQQDLAAAIARIENAQTGAKER
ncbi:phosphatase domain-containing protein [Hahella sp. NBU794]|uniref:phosphatase domain-containing protein n=1 Tax=Hahella sp. NBU794 TaxID=3422590 RepID=UPI003D6F9996